MYKYHGIKIYQNESQGFQIHLIRFVIKIVVLGPGPWCLYPPYYQRRLGDASTVQHHLLLGHERHHLLLLLQHLHRQPLLKTIKQICQIKLIK